MTKADYRDPSAILVSAPKAGYAARRGFERLKMFVLAALSITKDSHHHEG